MGVVTRFFMRADGMGREGRFNPRAPQPKGAEK